MRAALVVALSASLLACIPEKERVARAKREESGHYLGPTGRDEFLVKCSTDTARCYAKAAAECPGGYDVLSEDHELRHPVSLFGQPPGDPTVWYSMRVSCKPADPPPEPK
jgi:hypothetical protein